MPEDLDYKFRPLRFAAPCTNCGTDVAFAIMVQPTAGGVMTEAELHARCAALAYENQRLRTLIDEMGNENHRLRTEQGRGNR